MFVPTLDCHDFKVDSSVTAIVKLNATRYNENVVCEAG